MKASWWLSRLVRVLVVLGLLLPSVSSAQQRPDPAPIAGGPATAEGAELLYRTRVTLSPGRDEARLEKLGITVLQRLGNQALVLVDEQQLEDLARLRFEPEATNALSTLLVANQAYARWLAAALQPQLRALAQAAERDERLRLTLTVEQASAVSALASVDDDGDGLTNTQELWWCTDPLDADTDDDGKTDGTEVGVLKAWLGNQRSGPPMETPWPNWPPQRAGCDDKDHDSIPNLAERWELGLSMDLESTDRDKFDDGQELFGVTYCPGGDLNCGYGTYPRSEDSGFVPASMPSWVKAPGNHPFVAAFPVPEIDVVPSSLHVQTVTTVTTDHTIAEGVERSYATTKTQGTSSATSDTVTWNDWQEVSVATPLEPSGDASAAFDFPAYDPEKVKSMEANALQLRKEALVWDVVADVLPSPFDILTKYPSRQYEAQNYATEQYLGAWKQDAANKCDPQAPYWAPSCLQNGLQVSDQSDVIDTQVRHTSDQESPGGGSGLSLSVDATNEIVFQPVVEVSFPVPRQLPVRTETTGKSWGGAHTTAHSEYEEQSVSTGEAFSDQESWGSATAEDSSHAADLWFSYSVRNSGTEYAREIANLAFNVYLGDNPNPVATYFVATDVGGDGKFHNFMPGEEHGYTSQHIPLTLEQMKAIDVGGSLYVVVEDFTYGNDELFYQDAVHAGVWVAVEDGLDDSTEGIDRYLIPTWAEEMVQDLVARYFPYEEDADGNIAAIWTPEYRTDTPAWCQDGYHLGGTLWCKHVLSAADWWNIYLDNLGDGTTNLQDTPAAPDSTVFFRFNKDSDLDGYSDRSEWRLGTDPDDPASHPNPELIAGLHSIGTSSYVTSTLSLLNTGLYDAYGVEAVMIAPDDSLSITNNTVGGSGRVKAQKQVIVGSRILSPAYTTSSWTGTAKPASGGYFTASRDITYTFTVVCTTPGGCDVGAGTWSLNWSDGLGGSGSLNPGAGYASPTLLSAGAWGVKVSLLSGKVQNGNSFTVQARTPRDTFQYTINAEPQADPVVLVSYNDPQGNHRFITPVDLAAPTDDLVPYSGQMLEGLGAEIVTRAPVGAPGSYSTDVVVNWPIAVTLSQAHLFLEFVDITGTVAAEFPVTTTVEPGPNVVPVGWSTDVFSPAFQAENDYIVMAFWTDWEGNIIDVAARPLSSFQEDPAPAFDMAVADETWDFHTAAQGTVMQRQFALASVGFMDLLAYVGEAEGITVEGPPSPDLAPGDMGVYTVTLNTADMDVGPFLATVAVRTSDAEHPTRNITIQGNVTPMPEDAPGGAVLRPLDWTVTVSGAHSQGEWVEFSHTLGPDPQTLHPVKVFSQDYAMLWGVGEHATPFAAGTASFDMFGDGHDGAVPNSGTINLFAAATATAGSRTVNTALSAVTGDVVLLHQTRGAGVGNWEVVRVASAGSGSFTTTWDLEYTYSSGAQAVKVPQYSGGVIGGVLTSPAYDGSTGGILALCSSGGVTVTGSLSAIGGGYEAGAHGNGVSSGGEDQHGGQGGGISAAGTRSYLANAVGGGGGQSHGDGGWGGGGGGHTTSGNNGGGGGYGANAGVGGGTAGAPDLALFGGGGGGGGADWRLDAGARAHAGRGGRGGGIVFVFARELSLSGSITANGEAGINADGWNTGEGDRKAGGGGGGAGGSIIIRTASAVLGTNNASAVGAVGGEASYGYRDLARGGAGGVGRIRVEYCECVTGSTNPISTSLKLECYIVEQDRSDAGKAQLSLPESFTDGRTYQVQYGRRMVFGGAGIQTPSIRLPKQVYASASLDALVSNTGVSSGPLNLQIDVGNDGTFDWTHNDTTTFPATLVISPVVEALNAYLVSRTDVAWGADLDVPFRVSIDRQADVILTNLLLSQQFNQPEGGALSIELGADRPLDWMQVVVGPKNQGDTVTFAHTIGPDPATINPCKVYDQSGTTLKGVGKYCRDFGTGLASQVIFGNGHDGAPPNSGVINTYASATASAGTTVVNTTLAVDANDLVLLHQSSGAGVGIWETVTVESVSSGSFHTTKSLNASFAAGAQAVLVPQYQGGTIGGSITPQAWNGTTGGIVAVASNGRLTVSGSINASEVGYRGGREENCPAYRGPSARGNDANGNGGGGGGNWGENANWGAGGGGGGNGTQGQPGTDVNSGGHFTGGAGGAAAGNLELTNMVFGGGGGGPIQCCDPRYGGAGGGIVVVLANELELSGSILSNGGLGQSNLGRPADEGARTGGGGAGGSILIRGREVMVGVNLAAAAGGGTETLTNPIHFDGGHGGDGRIAIEYCDTYSGGTAPSANVRKLDCHLAEQVEQDPWSTTWLYLPEAVPTSQTYLIQYARRFVFPGAGEQTSYLRLSRQMYGSAGLDALVSNTGVSSGNLALSLDIGDNGDDFTYNASTTFPATIAIPDITSALNAYLQSRTDVAWGQPVDVPVSVQVDRQADVMLTNLALTPVGAKTRFVRLPAQEYGAVTIDLQFGTAGDPGGLLAFTVDVGANGSVDWSESESRSFPASFTSPDLAVAFNAYLSGLSGDVDVPIRIVPSPYLATRLEGFAAVPAARPDAGISPMDIAFGALTPVEGDIVPVTATLQNTGTVTCGPLVASFFATAPGWGEWYIGSAFVPAIPAAGTAPAAIDWDTLGFAGAVPVRVVLDPYYRLAESNEGNNEASSSLTLLTRPDLLIHQVLLSDAEPVAGEAVTVTLVVSNTGQTAASDAVCALYDGNPDAGGSQIAAQTITVPGASYQNLVFVWTPASPGLYRLFAGSDRENAVWEYDEGNNESWRDVYVGLAGPHVLDSGAASDVAYTTELGYGYVDEGLADILPSCGAGTLPEDTLRQDPAGRVVYRFDHLLPGHFYHLDVTLSECDGAGRQESIYVDGNWIAGPVDLSDGEVHQLSLRLDPALYADRTISVTVEAPGIDGALVGEVRLHDIDYRYADCGGGNDPTYSAAQTYGWLEGTANTTWGTLPYQSVRVNLAGNQLRYRFDRLDPYRRYQVLLTFWLGSGATRQLKVQMDGTDTGTAFDVVAGQVYTATIEVPPGDYQSDRQVIVGIVRTNASTGAMLNEIALEEITLVTPVPGALGGVNDDGVVDSTDALIILTADVGLDTTLFCPMNCGDVNADGFVDSTDALIVLTYDVGLSVPFPVGTGACPASITQPPGCSP